MSPQPIYSNNPQDWTAVEGLSISSTTPPAGIVGVSLNTVGVVGQCVRGPIDTPVLCGTESRFEEVFGARDFGAGGAIVSDVWKALLNKPFGGVVVVRAAAAGAAEATLNLVKGTAAAVGAVTCDTASIITSGDTVTLTAKDTTGVPHTVVFEFRHSGSAAAGHVGVDISSATSAANVATALQAAIAAQITSLGLALTAAVDGTTASKVDLTSTSLGTAFNLTLSKVSSSSIAVTTTAGTDQIIATLTANGPGSWGNGLSALVAAASDGVSTHWNLAVTYLGKTKTLQNLNTTTGNDNTLAVLGDDEGNWYTIAKVNSGQPDLLQPATAFTSGSDGTIADTDYIASGRGVNQLTAYKDVGVVFVAGRSNSTVKSYLKTIAAASVDRFFLACPDSETVSEATAITEAATLTTGGKNRLIYCFNHCSTLDPQTGTQIWTEPHAWLASILSQVDVDIHPGEDSTKAYTAGISKLYNENLARPDYVALRAAGICALEDDNGFAFVSGVTTDGGEITDYREIDFLNLSVAARSRSMVKKKNTATNRRALIAPIQAFFEELKQQERILEDYQVDDSSLNTPTTRGENIEQVLLRGRLISHMNFLVLQTEYGTSVTISQ